MHLHFSLFKSLLVDLQQFPCSITYPDSNLLVLCIIATERPVDFFTGMVLISPFTDHCFAFGFLTAALTVQRGSCVKGALYSLVLMSAGNMDY